MKYDESANGSQIEAKVGNNFEISLPETRTAGYRWVMKDRAEPACHLLEDVAQPNTSGVGGTGHHLWRFRAAAPGTGKIEFHYLRAWEDSEKPARTFVLTVRVRV